MADSRHSIAEMEASAARDARVRLVRQTLRDERGDALHTVRAGIQERIETILDRHQPGGRRHAHQHRGIVVAFGAEQDGAVVRRLPVGESNERGGPRRQTIHDDAMPSAPVDLGGVGVHEGDGHADCAEGMTDGTADAAGSDDVDRFHAVLPLLDGPITVLASARLRRLSTRQRIFLQRLFRPVPVNSLDEFRPDYFGPLFQSVALVAAQVNTFHGAFGKPRRSHKRY